MAARKKRKGMPLKLLDLTLPARALGVIDGDEDDANAEYTAVRTIRGAKLRPGMFAEAWFHSDEMDEKDYLTEVYIMGIHPDPAAEEPSPYDVVVDVLHTIKRSQAIAIFTAA